MTNCFTFENEFMDAFRVLSHKSPTDENSQAIANYEKEVIDKKKDSRKTF